MQITTHVKGYPPHKNDFLFEKHLNEKVLAVLLEHWGQKPVLTFCSSRKGAAALLPDVLACHLAIRAAVADADCSNLQQQCAP